LVGALARRGPVILPGMPRLVLLALIVLGSCGRRSDDATAPAGSSTPTATAPKEEPKAPPKEAAPPEAPRPALPAEVPSFITPEGVGLTRATGESTPCAADRIILLPGPCAEKCVATLLYRL